MSEIKEEILRGNDVVVTKELAEAVNETYAELAGKPVDEVATESTNGTPLSDKTFEAMVTDPNLILVDFRALAEKHGLDFIDILNTMGFTKDVLNVVLRNKPITEQIFVFSRELKLMLFRLGELSGTVEEGYSTLNIRMLLDDPESSEAWLEILDKHIFPYMKHFKDHGKIDKDWFLKNETDNEIQAVAELTKEVFDVSREIATETVAMSEGIEKAMAAADANEVADEAIEQIFSQGEEAVETEEVSLTHGNTEVASTLAEQLNELDEEVDFDSLEQDLDENGNSTGWYIIRNEGNISGYIIRPDETHQKVARSWILANMKPNKDTE